MDPMENQIHIQDKMRSRSKLQTYSDLVVGKRGLIPLIKYELIQMCAAWVPGALGLFLRSKLYPRLLGSCGRACVFGMGVTLRHPHKIHLGDGCVIDDHALLDAKGENNEGIRMGEGCFIGRNSILSCKNGNILLGDQVNLGFHCEIFSGSTVTLGDNCLLAAYSYLVGGGHDFENCDGDVLDSEHVSKGIELEKGVWIGAGVQVLDGTHLGEGCIIGAGGVVTADVEARAIATGIPARIRRHRDA